jgi:outer membrane lipoprotein-sorting protein
MKAVSAVLLALLGLLPTEPVAAGPGPDSAEAVFKRMEQTILKCKTFKTDLEITLGPGKDNLMKGRLLIGQGNKVRLELEGSVKGKAGKITMVSDGTKMRTIGDTGSGKDQDAPKQLREIFLASVTRTGLIVPMFLVLEVVQPGQQPPPFDLDKDYAVSDIRLGKKETVSGKEAQAIDFKVTVKTMKQPLPVTVWIDVKTNLPLKRVVTVQEGKEMITITEQYANAAIDGKIDDKEFVLPK